MSFCVTCGTQVADGAGFCPSCGTKMPGATAAAPPPAQAPPPAYTQQPQYGAAQPVAAGGGLTENVAGLLCYIPFFVGLVISIVFLVIDPYKQQKFVRFHAFQSIFLHIALFAIGLAGMIVSTMLAFISFGLAALFSTLMTVVWLGSLVLIILLMVKANQGQKWSLPVIGPMAEKQA